MFVGPSLWDTIHGMSPYVCHVSAALIRALYVHKSASTEVSLDQIWSMGIPSGCVEQTDIVSCNVSIVGIQWEIFMGLISHMIWMTCVAEHGWFTGLKDCDFPVRYVKRLPEGINHKRPTLGGHTWEKCAFSVVFFSIGYKLKDAINQLS